MKKRVIKYIAVFIILLGGVVVGINYFQKDKYNDLISYEENLLGIEFREYVDGITGNIKKSDGYEDHAYIRLEVKDVYEEEMIDAFKREYPCISDIVSYTMPGYQNHELAIEMKSRTIKYIFVILMEGKHAKTREFDVYITEDENNKMYVYIFG